jgi:serine/threonine protein kinase
MGDTRYGPPIDMWSVGCIFAEILLQKPLLDGITELEQVDRMCSGMVESFLLP